MMPSVQHGFYGVNFPGWLPEMFPRTGSIPSMPITNPMMLIGTAMNWASQAYLPPMAGAQSPWRGPGMSMALTSNQLLYTARMAATEFTYQRRGMAGMGWGQVLPPQGIVLGTMMGGMGMGGRLGLGLGMGSVQRVLYA